MSYTKILGEKMSKYKNLIILLVIFGAIHFIFTHTVIPPLSRWLLDKGFESQTYFHQIVYFVSLLQYATVIIWIPVCVWIYRDSKKNMFAPWLWAILVLIAQYFGLIIYLLIKLLAEKGKKGS